jgi:hypothetical protein
MYWNLGMQVVSAKAMIRDMGCERPLWPELVAGLLDGEAGPVCWRLISKRQTVIMTFASVTYCRPPLPHLCLARRRVRKSRLTGDAYYQIRMQGSSACL